MKSVLALSGAIALAAAQGPPPAPVLLTTTTSGVLPVIPTATPGANFTGVETIEGALTYDGPANPGFTGLLGNATAQQNTPGISYTATLPTTEFDPLTGTSIQGTFTLTVPSNGTGVIVTANLTNLPAASYAPAGFPYHIHAMQVVNGNCTTAGAHLDPTDRGEYYPCSPTHPETCQAGDLSGKHGNITGSSFHASYLELFLSTNPTSPYFIGNKAIVIHSSNSTRLTCANFVLASNSTALSNSTAATATGSVLTTTLTQGVDGVGGIGGSSATASHSVITATISAGTGVTSAATASAAMQTTGGGHASTAAASATGSTTAVAPYTGEAARPVVQGLLGVAAIAAGAMLL